MCGTLAPWPDREPRRARRSAGAGRRRPASTARARTASSIGSVSRAGEGVLLAGVVAAEQRQRPARPRPAATSTPCPNAGRGRGSGVARPPPAPATAPSSRSRRARRPPAAGAQQRELADQPRRGRCRARSGVGLLAGGAQRTAATIRTSMQLLARRRRGCRRRLVGQPGPVQRGEEPVAAAVAGEDPAGAVAAVRGRRQPDDGDPRRRPAPARAPAGPSTSRRRTRRRLTARDLLAPGHQPRAGPADRRSGRRARPGRGAAAGRPGDPAGVRVTGKPASS